MASWTLTALVALIAVIAIGAAYFYLEDQSLQTQNTSLNSTVNTLQGELTQLQAQDSQLQSQMTSLQTALSSLGGQVPGSNPGVERLVLVTYVKNDSLVISIGNMGASQITVTQVVFNGSPVANSNVVPGGPFTTSGNSFNLASGATGTLSVTAANVGNPKPGVAYEVAMVTAAGNTYSSTITWP
jgi:FtsZ-binding cell division protein ZapB